LIAVPQKVGSILRFSLLSIITALLGLQSAPVIAADTYEISLTRKSNNLYEIIGKDAVIQTKYCSTFALAEDAIFKSGTFDSEIIFLDRKERCDVKAVFSLLRHDSGKYEITVSRDEENWYEVSGTDVYIQTSWCSSYAIGQKAILIIDNRGWGRPGRLLFSSGSDCTVENVYRKLRS
jgi:hypothetical protein